MKDIIYYINKLPIDIIINNILPYTYELQANILLEDIKNFYTNYNFIKNRYLYNLRPIIILNDLLLFCNNNDNNYIITQKFYNIISRHYMLNNKNKNKKKLTNYIYTLFNNNDEDEVIINKIKIIYGLLTPVQRDNFYYFIVYNLYNR